MAPPRQETPICACLHTPHLLLHKYGSVETRQQTRPSFSQSPHGWSLLRSPDQAPCVLHCRDAQGQCVVHGRVGTWVRQVGRLPGPWAPRTESPPGNPGLVGWGGGRIIWGLEGSSWRPGRRGQLWAEGRQSEGSSFLLQPKDRGRPPDPQARKVQKPGVDDQEVPWGKFLVSSLCEEQLSG